MNQKVRPQNAPLQGLVKRNNIEKSAPPKFNCTKLVTAFSVGDAKFTEIFNKVQYKKSQL